MCFADIEGQGLARAGRTRFNHVHACSEDLQHVETDVEIGVSVCTVLGSERMALWYGIGWELQNEVTAEDATGSPLCNKVGTVDAQITAGAPYPIGFKHAHRTHAPCCRPGCRNGALDAPRQRRIGKRPVVHGLSDHFVGGEGERHGFTQRIFAASHAHGEGGLRASPVADAARCIEVSKENLGLTGVQGDAEQLLTSGVVD